MTPRTETKDDMIRALRESSSELRALGVSRIGLFGSFVRGQQSATSDVDVLVDFEPGRKSFDSFMRVCFHLEDLLQRSVEVVTPASLSPHLGPHILREVEYVPLAA